MNENVVLGDYIETLKGFAFKSSCYSDYGISLVKVSDFTSDSIGESTTFLPKAIAEKYEKYAIHQDDVIIQTVGSWPTNPMSVVGKVVRVPQSHENSLLNQNAVKLSPNSDLDNNFLFYLLKSPDFFRHITGCATGAASQASVTLEDIKSFKFSLISKNEQLKIANILKSYDKLIENNNRRIAILEEMAQRLYRNNVKKTDETCLLGDVVTFKRGRNITKSIIRDGNVPVVAGGLQPAYYHDCSNTKAPVLTVSASGANAGYVNLYHVDIWASDCSFLDANNSDNVFFYYVCMKDMQEQITFMQRGSAQPHVYPDDLGRLEIPCLPNGTVVSLNKKLSDIFNAVGNLTKKNENLRKTRDLLLPRLISGDIDVSKIDMPVEDVSQ